ncbi:Metallothionein-like protein type 3 [Ananas comosus]|uniref:Metallothionein-like protein type 3 n=1 Tax=Ananas comosus TaxID=4615 RepID=A0A199VY29_ANACO|nr:Metallothionein-like protein type 3 [Ananas comosus]
MSSTCGNCDCADKSQCVSKLGTIYICRKKGNSYGMEIVETEKSYFDSIVEAPAAAEYDGKCKCGASCACVDCTCGK